MSKLDYIELYPKVEVYKNVLADPEKMYQVMKDSERNSEGKHFLKSWDPWAHFGTYTQKKNPQEIVTGQESDEMFIREKEFVQEVEDAYSKVLMDYVDRHGIELPDGWRFSGCSYSKYNPQINTLDNNMTMQYHTDHITSQKDMPGDKFFITCTMYINDDYDGGDIEFYVGGELINHKPVAGDILVFPSVEPYYHGVKTIEKNEKFFVRNFVMIPFDGTKEWLENQKRFGAYKWAQMEAERIKHEDPRNMRYLENGKPTLYDDLANVNGGNK
jgi:hypothetical protein